VTAPTLLFDPPPLAFASVAELPPLGIRLLLPLSEPPGSTGEWHNPGWFAHSQPGLLK